MTGERFYCTIKALPKVLQDQSHWNSDSPANVDHAKYIFFEHDGLLVFRWYCSFSAGHRLNWLIWPLGVIDLPNLLSAASILLGLLVAAMTITWDLCFKPSISVKSWDTILLSTSPWVCKNENRGVLVHLCAEILPQWSRLLARINSSVHIGEKI